MDIHSQQLFEMRSKHHEACHVCGELNPDGMCVVFDVSDKGGVEACVICNKTKEGYDGYIHGGVIASLLDSAMTNCLFSYGIAAVTAEMSMRIMKPVISMCPMTLRAVLEKDRSPLYVLKAELLQDELISARAKGKFIEKTYRRD